MARRHVKILRTDEMQWDTVREKGDPADDPGFVPQGLHKKILSIDERTRAQSLMIKADVGWSDENTYFHTYPVETYIMKGRVKIGNDTFTEGCYSYIQPGNIYGPMKAEEETVFLRYIDNPVGHALPDLVKKNVPFLDTNEVKWEKFDIQLSPGGTGDAPEGAWFKIINEIPSTGGKTIIGKFESAWEEPFAHYHIWSEEFFILDGKLEMDYGLPGVEAWTWPKHGYCFRPPGILHCPVKTPGCHWIMRCDGWEDLNNWKFDNFHLHRETPYGLDKWLENPVLRRRYQ